MHDLSPRDPSPLATPRTPHVDDGVTFHRTVHVTHIGARGPLGALALAAVVIALGGALLLVGFTIIAGLGVLGAVAGAGVMLYRKLTGRGGPTLAASVSSTTLGDAASARRLGLDPSREIVIDEAADARRLGAPERR